MPHRIGLDFYASQLFWTMGENWELLHLWEDIITLVVDYYKSSEYYTVGLTRLPTSVQIGFL